MLTIPFIKGLFKLGMTNPQTRIIALVVISTALIFYTFMVAKLRRYLHMLQLSNYYNLRFLKWMARRQMVIISWDELLLPLIGAASYWLKPQVTVPAFILSLLYLTFKYFTKKEKKPFVFTLRAKRIFLLSLFLNVAILFFTTQYFFNNIGHFLSNIDFHLLIFLNLINIVLFLVPILANIILFPFEYLIQQYYIRDAKAVMKGLNLKVKVIGITGSYGKTSTKHILNELLNESFSSIATPGSINTELGVTKIVRKELKFTHDFFVVEMGARMKGDIAKVCNITKPDYAVVTAIGNQHLETFKSKSEIAKTKFEIIENLTNDGILFLKSDDNEVMKFAEKSQGRQVVTFGEGNNPDYLVKNIKNTKSGLNFTIQHKDKEYQMETSLLGVHNAWNIAAAAAVANTLGVKFDRIEQSVKRLQPIQHRLQLINKANGVKVLDDAFNSNLIGAKSAIDAMVALKTNKAIIVTPGIVELGSSEQAANIELAQYAAKKCDFIIVVGKKQGKSIVKGLVDAKFDKKKYFIAKDLNQAIAKLDTIVNKGDIVLFENDLPDQYD